MAEVVIVDYGVGNIYSIARAIEFCGDTPILSSDPVMVSKSRKIILPGVGAFPLGISQLRNCGLADAVLQAVTQQTPILGICLGMQFLLDEGYEFGVTAGLGLIPGVVSPICGFDSSGLPVKVPHIGWADLELGPNFSSWDDTILRGVPIHSPVYFVHSFMAHPSNSDDLIASCLYGDQSVSAVISRNNVWGMQFHPEKSGVMGLKMLNNFLKL